MFYYTLFTEWSKNEKIDEPTKRNYKHLYSTKELTLEECCQELGIKLPITLRKWMKEQMEQEMSIG